MAVVDSDFEPGRDVPQAWLERAARVLGMSASELELPPTRVRLLLPRTRLGSAERHLRAARLGLAWLGLWYGPYPYPQLTVVVPPFAADEAGGMEYPTFITGLGNQLTSIVSLLNSGRLIRIISLSKTAGFLPEMPAAAGQIWGAHALDFMVWSTK
jgi:hypothetical protein